MAVKTSYGIRTAMLASQMDTEIVLEKDGIGLRPIPIKFILMTLVSALICFKCVNTEFISYGSTFQKVLFVALWMGITLVCFFSDKTKQMNFFKLFSGLNYFSNPANRKISTRRTDPANDMMEICNIADIDDSDGLITFCDKSVGYMYRVTGSASALLFESDRNAIINAVDMFYRKPDSDTEFIFLTTKEAQQTYRQIAAIQRRYKNLTVHDPDLIALLDAQLKQLREKVGKEYMSIHQYMILKSKSSESLHKAKLVVQSELDSGAMMIRRCVPLDKEEIIEQFSKIYTVPKIIIPED